MNAAMTLFSSFAYSSSSVASRLALGVGHFALVVEAENGCRRFVGRDAVVVGLGLDEGDHRRRGCDVGVEITHVDQRRLLRRAVGDVVLQRDFDAVDDHRAVVRLEADASRRAVGQLAAVNEQLVVDALRNIAVIRAYGELVEFVRIDRFFVSARVGDVPRVRRRASGEFHAVGRRRVGADGHLIIRIIKSAGRRHGT